MALSICENNSTAATALIGCALTAVVNGDYLPEIARFIEPKLTVCASAKKCIASNPIPAPCVEQFENDRKALCNCVKDAETFVQQNAGCASTRALIEELKTSNAAAVSQARPLPQNPEFDICGVHENPLVQCEALEKKVAAATSAIKQMVALGNKKQ